MKKKRGPAFQFYPDKWLAATRRLSSSAYRLYHSMLCWMWLESDSGCSMSTDPQFIAVALCLPLDEAIEGLKEIQLQGMELFHVNKRNKTTTTYVSFGLQKEYKKQTEWRQKSARGGRAGAKSKLAKKLQAKGGSTTLPTKALPKAYTPSPSPSPSLTTLKEEESVSKDSLGLCLLISNNSPVVAKASILSSGNLKGRSNSETQLDNSFSTRSITATG